MAYDSDSATQLARLYRLQCDSLWISTGVMQGTSLVVLQAHCGEMPLRLCRLKSQIEYSVKVRCSDGRVSSLVFDEHWTHHYGTYNDWNLPIAIKVADFHDTVEMSNVQAPKTGGIPPWLVVPLKTVDQLSNCINKYEQPQSTGIIKRPHRHVHQFCPCVY